ncbi:uncharacterized protein LOC62_01G000124 [Vanrija pseudolonga]|uniref:Uncharacterized protein n=1 Tax=Vanrija pseudolonga TaxID=143232 RepID=A0AAF0Y2S1_9TREE|nr:hypothetical protein LOC62_01G000124 [Vanrija pseudolonga]
MDAYTAFHYFSIANTGPNFLPVTFDFQVWQVSQVYAVHPKFGVGGRNLATVEGEREEFQEALTRFQRRVTRWVTALKEGESSGSRRLASIQEEERTHGSLQYLLDLVNELADIYQDAHQHDSRVVSMERDVGEDGPLHEDYTAALLLRAAHFAAVDDIYQHLDVELQELYQRVKGIRGNPFLGVTLDVQEAMNALGFAAEAYEVLHEEVVRCVDL